MYNHLQPYARTYAHKHTYAYTTGPVAAVQNPTTVWHCCIARSPKPISPPRIRENLSYDTDWREPDRSISPEGSTTSAWFTPSSCNAISGITRERAQHTDPGRHARDQDRQRTHFPLLPGPTAPAPGTILGAKNLIIAYTPAKFIPLTVGTSTKGDAQLQVFRRR